jgi:hypothetical protein
MQNRFSFDFDIIKKALLPMSPPHGGGDKGVVELFFMK